MGNEEDEKERIAGIRATGFVGILKGESPDAGESRGRGKSAGTY